MSITGPQKPRSKKWRFAFQTCTETPATTPSILGFGISHHPHEGGDGAKCGAKFADTPCVIYIEVNSADPQSQNTSAVRNPPTLAISRLR